MRIVPRDLVVVHDGWNHIALTRASGEAGLYINGVRVTKDLARYSETFAVPLNKMVESIGFAPLAGEPMVDSTIEGSVYLAPAHAGDLLARGVRITNGVARYS